MQTPWKILEKWRGRGRAAPLAAPAGASGAATTKARGQAAEDAALHYLQQQGLKLVARNYRTPGRGGGEIDIIAQDGETLVFVEVRQRSRNDYGGAAASVGHAKQKHLRFAAQRYLQRYSVLPPCRFDVLAVDDEQIEWLRAAFD